MPAMTGAGAELDVVFAQPGFQHRQHSSTNGLAGQHEPNATKGQKMTEKQEEITLQVFPNTFIEVAMIRLLVARLERQA